jgi:hypothetical protein
MHTLQNLPLRQKILLSLTLLVGFFILLSSLTNAISNAALNTLIFCYSFGVPLYLLIFETLIDLNEPKIFSIWFAISLALLVISFLTANSDKFLFSRSISFDKSYGINSHIFNHSTSSLKSLFVFLSAFWILNKVLKRLTGNSIVNTYRQFTWFNKDANRKITGLDVVVNIILFLVVFIASLIST